MRGEFEERLPIDRNIRQENEVIFGNSCSTDTQPVAEEHLNVIY